MQEPQLQTPGEEFGRKAVAEVLSKAHNYCDHETQRIALTNNAKMTALRAELALLGEEDKETPRTPAARPPCRGSEGPAAEGHLLLVRDGVSRRRGLFLFTLGLRPIPARLEELSLLPRHRRYLAVLRGESTINCPVTVSI
jgi:hypothetical protein